MGRFEGWNDPLLLCNPPESGEGLFVGNRGILDPVRVLQIRVLGAHSWIIESCRQRMGGQPLSVLVLHEITVRAVENAWRSCRQWSSVAPGRDAMPTSFYSQQLDACI